VSIRRSDQRGLRLRKTAKIETQRAKFLAGGLVIDLGTGARFATAIEIEAAPAGERRDSTSRRMAAPPSMTMLIG
jgi:hypothetical protein